MDGLRLILLLIGAIIIAGVYLYSRRQSSPRRGVRSEPRFGGPVDDRFAEELPDDLPPLRAVEIDDAGDAQPVTVFDKDEMADPAMNDEQAGGEAIKVPVHDEKIIVLNILPQHDEDRFPGSDLLDVFDRAGLEYGQYNVFHRLKDTDEGPVSVFSVASATEPGSFEITTMPEQAFRGLTLFMVLPGPMRGVDAFADMLATARRIAEQIRGEVKDRGRSTLTRQTAHHIREEIVEFEHRLQLRS